MPAKGLAKARTRTVLYKHSSIFHALQWLRWTVLPRFRVQLYFHGSNDKSLEGHCNKNNDHSVGKFTLLLSEVLVLQALKSVYG